MTLYYLFDDLKYPGYEFEYEYEPSMADIKDFMQENFSDEDIIRDFILSGLYAKESEANKNILKEYDNFDGTLESIDNMSAETKAELARELLFDVADTHEDEIKEYFENEAYKQFNYEFSTPRYDVNDKDFY